jgi:glycosyltransferase involved in cell wall biosynthesis|tara:strand:+ start:109 stop:1167 length:1059 start_codon:yes stop_codon:yes gene_type:complete
LIAYFVYNLNKYSGASQQALLLAKHLKIPVVIFNHEKGTKFSKFKVGSYLEIINLPKNKILALLYIVCFLIKNKIKIIHLHGFFKYGIALGYFLRKKIVLKTTLMDSDDFETIYYKNKRPILSKFLIRCVDVNVCLTKQLFHRNKKFLSESRICIIPNGVDEVKNTPTIKNNIFCFVGLVCERKNTYESIEYFLKNYSELEGSKMYVVGPLEGLNELDNKYVEDCFKIVKAYEAKDKVVFTGNLDKPDVQEIFRISKALIFLSKNEGMPNVVLEAMISNCLPISFGLDGVVNDILGKDLARHLVIKNLEQRVDVSILDEIVKSSKAASIARRNYSIEVVSEKYKNLYRELTS